jgi:hypothetical protein
VDALRRFRAGTDPRLIVALYVLVSAAVVALTAFAPGYPNYGPDSGQFAAGSVCMSAMLAILIARRSHVAWWIAIGLYGVGLIISVLGFSPKFFACAGLYCVSLLLLRSASLERFVRRLPGTAAPAAG